MKISAIELNCKLLGLIFSLAVISTTLSSDGQASYVNLLCFVLIVLLGLPHGVVDPWLYDKTMMSKPKSLIKFCCNYITAALLMLVLWYFLPRLALLVFFSISALHFGRDWCVAKAEHSIVIPLAAGTMVITFPFVTQTQQTLLIINYLGVNANNYMFEVAALLLFFASLTLFAARQFLIVCQLLLLGVMSWLVNPFIYFCLYFCLLHSVLHYRGHFSLIALAFRKDRLVLLLLLSTTYAFTAVMLIYAKQYANFEAAMYQTVFWILSALTVPHMLVVERKFRLSKLTQ